MIKEVERVLLRASNKLSLISKSLEAHDLDKTLKRGFALVKQNSKFISRKINFKLTDPVTIKFFDGDVEIK
jgi:exonuclease VII large subunit